METKPGQKVLLVSNQYKLSLGGKVQVFQYALEIVGMEMWDANLVQKIVRFKRNALPQFFLINESCSGIFFFQPASKVMHYSVFR